MYDIITWCFKTDQKWDWSIDLDIGVLTNVHEKFFRIFRQYVSWFLGNQQFEKIMIFSSANLTLTSSLGENMSSRY